MNIHGAAGGLADICSMSRNGVICFVHAIHAWQLLQLMAMATHACGHAHPGLCYLQPQSDNATACHTAICVFKG